MMFKLFGETRIYYWLGSAVVGFWLCAAVVVYHFLVKYW